MWCDEQIEKIINHKNGLTQNTINTEQQFAIKQAVNQNVYKTERPHQTVYRDLYQQFKIPKYQDLLAKDFENALRFLGGYVSKTGADNQINTELVIPDNVLDNLFCVLLWSQRMRLVYEHISPAMRILGSEYTSRVKDFSNNIEGVFSVKEIYFLYIKI